MSVFRPDLQKYILFTFCLADPQLFSFTFCRLDLLNCFLCIFSLVTFQARPSKMCFLQARPSYFFMFFSLVTFQARPSGSVSAHSQNQLGQRFFSTTGKNIRNISCKSGKQIRNISYKTGAGYQKLPILKNGAFSCLGLDGLKNVTL